MTGQELGDRLTIRDVNVLDLELVRNDTGESLGQDAHPDGRVGEVKDASSSSSSSSTISWCGAR